MEMNIALKQTGEWEGFEVFSYSPRYVAQLYKDPKDDVLPQIADEITILEQLHAAGYPVPKPLRPLELNGRAGFLVEKIDGEILAVSIRNAPEKIGVYSQALARLHAQLHQSQIICERDDINARIVQRLEELTTLPVYKQSLMALGNTLYTRTCLCHFDFGPYHVLHRNADYYVIDWVNAGYGDRMADVAKTVFWLCSDYVPGIGPYLVTRAEKETFVTAYLQAYQRELPLDADRLYQWLVLFAAIEYDTEIQDEGPADDLDLLHAMISDFFAGKQGDYFQYLICD
jgi:Ser/Thr protein kinase RdoA (MazF antagonist)